MHTLMYILTQNSAASAFFQKEEKVQLYCEWLILNDKHEKCGWYCRVRILIFVPDYFSVNNSPTVVSPLCCQTVSQ